MAENLQEPHQNEDVYALNAATVDAILAALEVGARDRLLEFLGHMHPADVADLLEQIEQPKRIRMIQMWGADIDPEVLSELEEGVRDDVLETLTAAQLGAAVQELDTDDMVYLVEDLEDAEKEELLDQLDDVDRVAVEQSLTYPEYSAGRLMQREMVTAPAHWSVGDVIDFMRASDDLPEQFYDIIVVDPAMRPIGEVRLGRVMAHPRSVMLEHLMEKKLRTIPVDQSQEDVAYAFNQYHMIQAPVVNADGRLVGIITMDDAMDVLEDEAEEDMRLLAGVGDEEISDTTWEIARQRFPWLLVNLITAILASVVISLFSATIEAVVALAVLMPIVASMGGNGATQTLTVAVRAIATRDLTGSNAMRVVRRELVAGTLNGIAFAAIISVVGIVWFGSPMLGLVLAIAMIGNMAVAGLAGIIVPLTLDKVGADPALASGTFVTTVTDVVGFMLFLGLASVLLL
ncbi:magnesium transporter [Monaibacterium marinum]|uniref:Magnesium transporter MgtE n=1 Tax=Pontivivens marinum TaxID=1690039 RepID=A0A2C9CTX9_9RHOB|nr:magnesium transporter [Monaibacterium marinum]SOH94688.1 magnesium transporter [Monaibacterium marinum]